MFITVISSSVQYFTLLIPIRSNKRRSSIGTFMRPHSSEGNHAANSKPQKAPPPKLDYRSMVSIDDMPELFVSFDSKYCVVVVGSCLWWLWICTLFLHWLYSQGVVKFNICHNTHHTCTRYSPPLWSFVHPQMLYHKPLPSLLPPSTHTPNPSPSTSTTALCLPQCEHRCIRNSINWVRFLFDHRERRHQRRWRLLLICILCVSCVSYLRLSSVFCLLISLCAFLSSSIVSWL